MHGNCLHLQADTLKTMPSILFVRLAMHQVYLPEERRQRSYDRLGDFALLDRPASAPESHCTFLSHAGILPFSIAVYARYLATKPGGTCFHGKHCGDMYAMHLRRQQGESSRKEEVTKIMHSAEHKAPFGYAVMLVKAMNSIPFLRSVLACCHHNYPHE